MGMSLSFLKGNLSLTSQFFFTSIFQEKDENIFDCLSMTPVSHTKISAHVSQKYVFCVINTSGAYNTWNITINNSHSITAPFLLLNTNFKLLTGTH